jgi:predicted acyltransferase
VTGRRRAGRSRISRALTAEWWALATVQVLVIIGAGALIAAVWTGVRAPRWVLTADAALLAGYALGVLVRGRPPEPAGNPGPRPAATGRHDGRRK